MLAFEAIRFAMEAMAPERLVMVVIGLVVLSITIEHLFF